jgi:hypothetical protein
MAVPKEEKYFKYVVKEDTTVDELLNSKDSIFSGFSSKREFFDTELWLLNNLDRINGNYNDQEREDNRSNYLNYNLSLVKAGTELVVQKAKVPVTLVALRGKNLFLEQSNYPGFWSKTFLDINNDPSNLRSLESKDKSGQVSLIQKSYNVSLWVYIRSLDTVLDLTKFIHTVNTSNTLGGVGTFSFSLEGFSDLEDYFSFGNEGVINYSTIKRDINSEIRINQSFFSKFLQQKDVVFIRFDKLDIEKDRFPEKLFNINKNRLSGQIYDMIGFIDNVVESFNSSSNDITVNVTGRDLNGLLIDDASYFYPVQFIKDSENLEFNINDDSRWFKRNFILGEYENLFVYDVRKIKDSIGFVINQLSNLGIVSDDLFSGYDIDNNEGNDNRNGKRRTQGIRISGDKEYIEWVEANGIWQIIDVLVDDILEERRQANSQLVNSEGSLMGQMNNICQDPFAEFYGDTYGDKFVFIAREPPYKLDQILSYLNQETVIEIDSSNLYNSNLNWENEYYTSYQIEPNNNFLGVDKNTALGYYPIVYLPTYVDKFGNKRYLISDSYVSEKALKGDEGDIASDPFREAIINDFVHIINITQYLPFTRRGTININRDRRIKKGVWIRFKPTGEIFYVDGVSHDYSSTINNIEGSTVLNVKRGMVEEYLTDYFKIIDTELIKKTLINTLIKGDLDTQTKTTQRTTKVKSSFDVNDEFFNFFFQRRQFR